MNTKNTFLLSATSLALSASSSFATFTIFGDVDSIDTASRPENIALLENVRDGGSNILWMTGGQSFNVRGGNLETHWNGLAGVTVTRDLTSDLNSSLTGVDLIVYNTEFQSNVSLSSAGQAKLKQYH